MLTQLEKIMTINVTLQTSKAGQLAVYTIEFNPINFDKVIDTVSEVKTKEQLTNSKLWTVK